VNSKVPNNITESISIRYINKNSILEFKMLLSREQWDNIFGNNNVNNMFNNFHNTYLRCFNACFPNTEIKYNNNNNMWTTKGIRISCSRKRELLLLCRYNRDPNLKIYYKQYCRILTRVISAAKRAHYNRMILKSNNKVKSTWKIINEEKGNIKRNKGIQSILIEKK
jgi:hypothetical protein